LMYSLTPYVAAKRRYQGSWFNYKTKNLNRKKNHRKASLEYVFFHLTGGVGE
jgi:hypothetical protein